ncbi:shugoshin 1-like isoform X2 [Antechinus flavipes]|uniref:shugoshin 1-like isoform X2 n=1 Tax=Antechinus flavipes TaxID=38775 RepID=UPI0022365938|nr:shugoshin 1-like isoform X2 [Antechinus flavipes]
MQNKILRELETYISAKLLWAIRESDPFIISEDINIENLFIDDNTDKHRTSLPHGLTKSSLKDPTTDVEKRKQPENQESYNLENTSFSSPIPTSKFLKESRTTLRRSSRNKENLVSYREPRLNCKLRRGDPFIDAVSLHSPINRKEEIMKNSKNTK